MAWIVTVKTQAGTVLRNKDLFLDWENVQTVRAECEKMGYVMHVHEIYGYRQ